MLEVGCTPIRRHSHSAPARILLDGCLLKLDSLSQRVDTVLGTVRQVRSKSLSVLDLSCEAVTEVDFILDEILREVVDRVTDNMPNKQCHHCHRLLSHPDHKGIGSGTNYCSLEHFDLCPGGRQNEKGWTGCPTTDDEVDDVPPKTDDSFSSSDTVTSKTTSPKSEINKTILDKVLTTESKIENIDPLALANALSVQASENHDVVEIEDTDDEEDMHLQEEIERLRLEVEQQAQARLQAEEKAKKEKKRARRENLEKQKSELLNQSRILQSKPSVVPAPVNKPAKVVEKTFKEKAAELSAKQ
jgi:hypothetical protein